MKHDIIGLPKSGSLIILQIRFVDSTDNLLNLIDHREQAKIISPYIDAVIIRDHSNNCDNVAYLLQQILLADIHIASSP